MKLLAAMTVVLLAFSVAPVLSRRGPALRSLLQATKTGTASYNYTLEILSYTDLANITNTTIFALDNKDWDALVQLINFTDFNSLLTLVKQNSSDAKAIGEVLKGLIVNGTHRKAEFSKPNQYTALAGNTFSVENNGTDYLLNFLTYPNGTAYVQNNNPTTAILSFDNQWQGNIVHVIGTVVGNNGTSGTAA